MLVFNATPLIYLAKAGHAELLEALPGPRVVPDSVHEEVVLEGQAQGQPDARRIGALVDDGILEVLEAPSTRLNKRLLENEHLHQAERDVLVLADAEGACAILDEKHGRRIADAEGIEHGGTIYLLLRLVEQGALSTDEAREVVDAIISEGWFCSTDLYVRIVRKLEGM